MQVERLSRKISGAILMVALCGSSTLAAASPLAAPARSGVSPAVALSILGSQASRTALCGTAAATAAGTTAAQAGPVQGCVLPATDAVAATPATEVVPGPAPVAVANSPSLVAPLLLGLAGLVGIIGLLALLKDDKGTSHPISPQ